MWRERLSEMGIELPVLPTVVLGGLPGAPDWAPRLARLGLDLIASGACPDLPATLAAAREEVPHLPVKAIAGDAPALLHAGAVVLESRRTPPAGALWLRRGADVVCAVGAASHAVEDLNDVARAVLRAARALGAARLWVAAGPGLAALPEDLVQRKLGTLVEGTRQARLALAKDQFDLV